MNSPSNPLPNLWFCLWEQGIASYYRYQAKKKDDKNPQILFNSLSKFESWKPLDANDPYTTQIEIIVKSESSNTTSPTKPTPSKTAVIKLKRIEPSEDPESSILQRLPGWPFPKDMTTGYLDRLNRLLLKIDKTLKSKSEYSPNVHAALYACLLESTRLAYHIYHDSTLDAAQRVVRFKMLNEWITRAILALDNITVPLIKDPSQPPKGQEDEEEEWIPDPEIRAKRKSLVNLALGIGSELSALIASIDPKKTNASSSDSNSNPTKAPPSMKNHWALEPAASDVYELLQLANPHHNTK